MGALKIKNGLGEWESLPIIKGDKGEKGDPGEVQLSDLATYVDTAIEAAIGDAIGGSY